MFGRNTWTGPEYPPTQNLMKSIGDIERATGIVRTIAHIELSRELRTAIARGPWKATTYVAPHEYVMEHWSPDCLELIAAIRKLINDHGYYREFRGKKFPTVHLDDHYYWQMPGSERWPLQMEERGHWSPICLNRATLPVAV
jgi:hypothetical protein